MLFRSNSHAEMSQQIRYDKDLWTEVLKGHLNYSRDGRATMQDDSFRIYSCRFIATILETLVRQNKLVDIDKDKLASLFKDKITQQPIDFNLNWHYQFGMSDLERAAMAALATKTADLQFQYQMSIPSQVNKLFNAKRLRWNMSTKLLEKVEPGDRPPKRTGARKKAGKHRPLLLCINPCATFSCNIVVLLLSLHSY